MARMARANHEQTPNAARPQVAARLAPHSLLGAEPLPSAFRWSPHGWSPCSARSLWLTDAVRTGVGRGCTRWPPSSSARFGPTRHGYPPRTTMLTAYDNGRLFGERAGTASPWILALHGWQRTHRDFARVLESLDALAVDLPGFGASPPPPEAWGGADYAAALLPILDTF